MLFVSFDAFGNSVARIGDIDDVSRRTTNPQSAVIGPANYSGVILLSPRAMLS